MSAHNFMAIHPKDVELFIPDQSGDWPADRQAEKLRSTGVHVVLFPAFKAAHAVSGWHHAADCTARIRIQIDQLDPIIHFCSGGSIVTKHKWPSSCLMSMIIISAICQGFSKHLLWTQHQAEMDPSRRHCLPLTNHHYWLSPYSLFAPLSCAVCPFFFFSFFLIILVLAIPTATPTPSSLCSPQPPPLSRSLDYVEPESGKVSLWKQGQRQWRALYGRERGGNRRRQKERKKTENWPVLRNPRVVISRRSDSKKKKKKQQVGNELYSPVSGGSTELWFESRTPYLTISAFSFFSPLPLHSSVHSFQWDSGKAMSNAPDVMRYNRRTPRTGDFSDPLCTQPPWCIDCLKCLKVIYISSSVTVMWCRSIR